MAMIGELTEAPGQTEIEWRIQNFPSLSKTEEDYVESPPFHFSGTSWKLRIYPNTKVRGLRRGCIVYIRIGLVRLSFGSPINVEYFVALKTAKGRNEMLKFCSVIYDENSPTDTFPQLLERNELNEKKSELMPSDVLTIICTLKNKKSTDLRDTHHKRLLDLADCLKKVHKNGVHSDLTLNVKGQKFPVHRMIMESRPTKFKTKLKANQAKEIDIEDISQDSIEAILTYMYTGDTDQLTTKNVFSVYEAADKYYIKQLKEVCSVYIQQNLSVGWICEVIKFAEKQQAEDIRCCAENYFIENAGKIIKTDYWKSFVREYKDRSIELLTALAERPVY